MRKKEKSLASWIDEVGVNKVAQCLCLERSTVRLWRRGAQIPKALHMYAIVELSKGSVSYAAIIEPWAKKFPQDFKAL